MTRWVFRIAWALFLLLAVAALDLHYGQRSSQSDPSPASYAPSGASALAEILRLRGYQVAVDNSLKPDLRAGDVVVAFNIDTDRANGLEVKPIRSQDQQGAGSDGDSDETDDEDVEETPETKAFDAVQSYSEANPGLVFWLPIAEDFETASSSDDHPVSVKRIDGQSRSLSGAVDAGVISEPMGTPLASVGGKNFVYAEKRGKGDWITYDDAIGLTNRYLNQADNAQFFLETLKAFAPNAKRVVFTEATYGRGAAPGLLESIGPWAQAAWYQVLFCFLIIVWTLNSRFGLPQRARVAQVGQREMVDGLTDILDRAGQTRLVLETALTDAEASLKKALKLRPGMGDEAFRAAIPAEVAVPLNELRAAATMEKVRPADALSVIEKVQAKIAQLGGRVGRSSQRPRKNLL